MIAIGVCSVFEFHGILFVVVEKIGSGIVYGVIMTSRQRKLRVISIGWHLGSRRRIVFGKLLPQIDQCKGK